MPTNRAPYDRTAYARRSRVGRLWGRLKEHRADAFRYDKTVDSYFSDLYLAAAFDWIVQRSLGGLARGETRSLHREG